MNASSGSPAQSFAVSTLLPTATMTACDHSARSRSLGMLGAIVSHTFTPSARFRTVEKPSSMTARGIVATRRDCPKNALFASRSIFPVSA